jgi:hypothetical protein
LGVAKIRLLDGQDRASVRGLDTSGGPDSGCAARSRHI